MEKDYTIVCLEQRGCGRTFYRNKNNSNLTIEQLLADTDEYLKCSGEMSGMKQIFTAVTSPEMSWNDARWFLVASKTQNIIPIPK
ncbi:MAG: hypothetical protein K2H52_14615 [Lachnospiraceae bacterium]|nr:hypothetical protein [Lachnospiraceae bacterium]